MKKYIYLAGPVSDQTHEAVNMWRDLYTQALASVNPNLIGVSPVRYEAVIHPEERYLGPGEYDENLARQITAKNRLDVKRCDLLLAFLPKNSVGTISEIGWAYGMEKPIIIIAAPEELRKHPVIVGQTPWIFDPDDSGFKKAMDVIRGLLEVYC